MKKLFLILATAVVLSICIFILPHSCNAKPYEKKITPEYENGALVFEKARHGMIKTLGTNFCTRKSLSIYIEVFDEKVANGKTPYRIFSTAENEIYLTNSRNLFFNELIRISTETNESRVYVLHHCSSASTFNVLPKEIEASGLFSECEYRKMPPETDGENFWKDIILDDNKKPVKNCDCTIYVLFEERLASEDDDWDEGMQRLQKYTKEELETSDKIGRIRAKTNKDGWLYVKGLPYDTCFIFYINNGK